MWNKHKGSCKLWIDELLSHVPGQGTVKFLGAWQKPMSMFLSFKYALIAQGMQRSNKIKQPLLKVLDIVNYRKQTTMPRMGRHNRQENKYNKS